MCVTREMTQSCYGLDLSLFYCKIKKGAGDLLQDMNNCEEDTIVAVATPLGRGAIGVVRLSGQRSLEIAGIMFIDVRGRRISSFAERTIYHGRLLDGEKSIDEVLMFVMKKPQSYTGEDLVEVSCHGNPIILNNVIAACVKKGARIAHPGEFTKRAFLNGKMDLTQAEAVAEVISARSEKAVSLAVANMNGKLRGQIVKLREGLLEMLAGIEACLDFPEEDIKTEKISNIANSINMYIKECDLLIRSFKSGTIIRDGLKVVIIGKANVGKSSLFNRLLDAERSIVTSHGGTTRDLIEESISINGMPIVLIDTAGISSKSANEIEIESMRRSKEALINADMLLFIIDRSCTWSSQDEEIAKNAGGKSGIVVFNKMDLASGIDRNAISAKISSWPSVEVSSLYGDGVERLKLMIADTYGDNVTRDGLDGALLCNIRHTNSIQECRDALQRAINAGSNGYHEEVIAMEMRSAIDILGEITGEETSDELLDKIFMNFCIGK